MIAASLSDSTGSLDLPPIEMKFLSTPLENAVDVTTLNGDVYTDFAGGQKASWEFNYDSLTEDEYNAIRAYYDRQFTDYAYPELTIPHYSLSDQPVRMYINEKDIWNHCGAIQNVKLTFRETGQLPEVS